jgi:hypothetical protein
MYVCVYVCYIVPDPEDPEVVVCMYVCMYIVPDPEDPEVVVCMYACMYVCMHVYCA